jgi:mRNA-degrading endonuclease RelE of RelBE toxin-antitoxin system
LTDFPLIEIRLTPDFKRQVRKLEKKYRHIKSDLQPILTQMQMGETIGDRLVGIDAEVFKVRVRNSDANRGKSSGYRVIYWLKLPECVVLLDIYSKSEQNNIEVNAIKNIIAGFTGVAEVSDDPETAQLKDDL